MRIEFVSCVVEYNYQECYEFFSLSTSESYLIKAQPEKVLKVTVLGCCFLLSSFSFPVNKGCYNFEMHTIGIVKRVE